MAMRKCSWECCMFKQSGYIFYMQHRICFYLWKMYIYIRNCLLLWSALDQGIDFRGCQWRSKEGREQSAPGNTFPPPLLDGGWWGISDVEVERGNKISPPQLAKSLAISQGAVAQGPQLNGVGGGSGSNSIYQWGPLGGNSHQSSHVYDSHRAYNVWNRDW